MKPTWIGSPSYTAGRGGKAIDRIVCHWIVGEVAAADTVFKNPAYQTSAHYAVGNGIIHQYVKETDTAWHAGNFDVNQRSIGIEHRGGPNIPITDQTYNTSADLIADICRRLGKRLPLHKHNQYIATACPGTLDLNKLNALVDQRLKGGTSVAAPVRLQDAQKFAFLMGGRDPSDPANIADLNRNHVGKDIYADLDAWWNSKEHQAYQANLKSMKDQAARVPALEARIKELESQGSGDSKFKAALKEFLGL